jgi:ribonuclease HIII
MLMNVPRNSFSVKLNAEQQERLRRELSAENYQPLEVPHAIVAVGKEGVRISLYASGACLVQGRGAEDWVTFVLEPQVIQEARLHYEDVLSPDTIAPHMGVDESGKGDFFGPMVIAAAYSDPDLTTRFRQMGVKDSKAISSDRKAEELARDIRNLLGRRYALVTIGPRAYNRLYAKMGSVNSMLAWGHARAIENLLEKVPDCPRAVADQFGPERQIRQALLRNGRQIKLVQRHKAESDPAVAAASILARAGFLQALRDLREQYGQPFPKGASAQTREAGVQLVRQHGPAILLDSVKCHFRTTDQVLAEAGFSRSDLGPEGRAVSKAARPEPKPARDLFDGAESAPRPTEDAP